MIAEALALPLFRNAIYAALLASVACGIIGSYVVVKRIASISGGLSHAAFGGVGLGHFAGFNPLLGAALFCLASAVGIGRVYRSNYHGLDTLIAMLWSLGMALGMLFISLTPGYAPELSSYLFGSILFVPVEYLFFAAILDILILVVVSVLFKELESCSFDEEFSEVMGLPVEGMFVLLLALTALAVVTLIRIVGVILTIALLTTPAVIARQWCKTLPGMMLMSVICTAFCSVSGLFFTFWLSTNFAIELPTGPFIILLVSGLYGLSSIWQRVSI